MALPEKAARPLKKRRIVSIEPDEEPVRDAPSRSSSNESRSKAKKKRSKRSRTTVSPLPSPSTSPATVIKKRVSWNDRGGNVVHVQPDLTKQYPLFNESDLWYTKNNYHEFLLDRLQTIESHRFLTANNMNNGNGNYSGHCIRGLELFHKENSNEQFQSKKKLYHSTIHMEQMRQAMLGIKDPERFRELVASQSDLALHRAQELAAQDAREAYSFEGYSRSNDKASKAPSSTSFSVFRDSSKNTWNGNNPLAPFRQRNADTSSFESAAESGGASVVSDVSSTDSAESASSNSSGQSLFANEGIRKLQERSMRRLMGIYQNNDGDGAEGFSDTNSLFKFARKDSLLGLRNNLKSNDITNTPKQNSSWAIPPQEDTASSPQERLMEFLHSRQLLQEQQQQPASREDSATLEEQIVEMLRQRQLLQEHIRQQKQLQEQQQQQVAPSLQEQLVEMMERRKILQGHGQQHRTAPCDLGDNTTTTSLIEEYLIQQRQHHEDHKNKMKLALMAMNATGFPSHRDTLSHLSTESDQNEVAATMKHHILPWSLSGMA